METDWQVFICYRRVDGSDVSTWLYHNLNKRTLPAMLATDNAGPALDVYFDQAAPAVGDWHRVHKPSLEQSRALIVVCTPGLYVRLEGEDWVHEELDWWLANRTTAPIIVDALDQGDRWVPDAIKRRWPNAQRIVINLAMWEKLSDDDTKSQRELSIERILGGISASEAKTKREDAERQRALNVKLRRLLVIASCAFIFAVVGLSTSLWYASKAQEQQVELNRRFALSLIEQAEDAWSRNDKSGGRALAARALWYDDSDEVKHRYHMLHDWMDKRYEKALERVEQILELDFQHAIDIALLPQLAERLVRGRSTRRAFDNFIALGAELKKPQYNVVLRFKGLTQRIESIAREQLFQDVKQRTSLERLIFAQSHIAELAYTPEEHREMEWPQRYVTAARKLAEAYSEVTPTEAPHYPSITWRELQRRLNDNEALVDYLHYRGRYVVWILNKHGPPVRYEVGEATAIERSAKKFRSLVSSFNRNVWSCTFKSDTSPQTMSRGIGINDTSKLNENNSTKCVASPEAMRFRDQVWTPVEAKLGKNVDTIYIVPDGVLATIPFIALPGRSSKKFLLDEKLIIHLASAHDLPGDASAGKKGKGILLIGGADYGDDARKVNPKSFQAAMSPLPGTLREIETIKAGLRKLKQVRPPIAYTDAIANEQAFRDNAPGKRIVHLATHGWAGDYTRTSINPELAALPGNIEGYIATLNPLLKAGVAFSPVDPEITVGHSDGIVTALEVSTLDLRGVELVILSGCDTLGTQSGGDTAIGLFRAFREAGASSVIASLYAVPDEETAELMVQLYKNLHTSDSPAVALREAAKEMSVRKGPYAWAGFVAYAPTRTNISIEDPKLEDETEVQR